MTTEQLNWLKRNLASCLSWAITFGWLIFIYFKIHNGILPTDLNEFGDFIAGAFAPLAFFWLVRGFYQQGKGLEQNSRSLELQSQELEKTTKALELQVQEMKLALIQQTSLAETTKQDLELSKKSFEYQAENQHISVQPFLHIRTATTRSDQEYFYIDFKISNSRAICRDVEIWRNTEIDGYVKFHNFDVLVNDPSASINLNTIAISRLKVMFKDDEPDFKTLETFKVGYLDSLDKYQEIIFQLVVKKLNENQDLSFEIQRPTTRNLRPLGFDI